METKFWHQSRAITPLKNKEKIICNCPYLHFVNINAFTKFYKNPSIGSQDIEHNKISKSIKGHNSVEIEQKILFNHPIYTLSISMQIQNLIEIHKLIYKILSINKILTSIKGHNSVKNWQKITCIRYNIDIVFINAYTKFYQNSSICSEDIEEIHVYINQGP